MRRIPIAGLVALALAGALDASASARPGDRIRAALAARMVRDDGPDQIAPGETLRYGADPAQSLSFWHARGVSGPAPLIVYVHGGGWSRGSKDNATGRWKVEHFPGEGYAFATIDYRLVPGATVEDEAADVAHALKALLDRAAALGIDRTRVVLMGHSAGAHLVALVGTDERYLRAAGLSFGTLAGVIPIDGAAYDVPAQMADGPGIMQQTYRAAFGTDPVRQRALSPTFQTAAPNVARWLILPVATRADSLAQSKALAAGLTTAGSRADVTPVPDSSHARLNHQLGTDGDFATGEVDRFLAALR